MRHFDLTECRLKLTSLELFKDFLYNLEFLRNKNKNTPKRIEINESLVRLQRQRSGYKNRGATETQLQVPSAADVVRSRFGPEQSYSKTKCS